MEEQKLHDEVLIQTIQRSAPEIRPQTYKPIWKDSYTQITGAGIIHLLTIQAGINMAFSAILVPKLKEAESDIKLEEGQDAWIASLVTISLPIGSLISGPLMDRYGRKNISLFICIPYLLSWILIYWSYDVVWLYVARVIAGAAGGMSNVAVIYTSETANPVWRSMLLSFNSVFVSFGILLTSILGMWFHWRTAAAVFGVLTALIFCLVTTLPESPHWLLSFGNGTQDLKRVTEARKSIKWFNRNDLRAEEEFNQLLITYRTGSAARFRVEKETLKEKFRSIKGPEIYKPIILLLIINFFQQISGSYVVVFYAVELFKELGGNFGFIDEYGAMIAMGTIRFVMAIVAFLLSRTYGRRTLCIISGIGMGITTLSASVYLQFDQSGNKIPTLMFVLLFVCSSAIGWQTIPWSLTGELLPTRVRAITGGAMTSYTYLLMFCVVQTYPALKKLIYIKGVFLSYSISSFLGALFVWKYLPETLGKTLIQIERYFK